MSPRDREFWAGRRVMLTGHTGFKGSWLALWLQRLGADVTGFSLAPPTEPSLFEVARVGGGMHSVQGDVRDFAHLRSTVAAARPDVVLHLAAQSVVRCSYRDPIETYSTNVMGTVNLLEAIRALDLSCSVVIVTSDKCYDNRDWVWGYREDDRLGGYDPYSSSKACAELVTAAYRRSYFEGRADGGGPPIATARAGNVIGGGDWTDDQLVPDVMRAFLEGRAVRIRSPQAVRPWQFVMEPLHGYLTLARRLLEHGATFAEAWNFGPEEADARPVSWIVERIAGLWSPDASWQRDQAPQPHEAHQLSLDSAKARARLGWEPHTNLEHALTLVVDWYKGYQRGEDMREMTESQIARYEELSTA